MRSGTRSGLVYLLLGSLLLGGVSALAGLQNAELCPPSDDAFVHFQYARLLAAGEPLRYVSVRLAADTSYAPGAPSMLWPVLLAPGALVGLQGLSLYKWALLLALGFWVGVATQVRGLLADRGEPDAFVAGLATIGCGPLLWGAASGMEIALAAFLTAAFLRALLASRRGAMAVAGLLLSFTCPEGALIVAILALAEARARRTAPWAVGLAAPGAIQPVLNLWLTGTLLPGAGAAQWTHPGEGSQVAALWENVSGQALYGGAGLIVLGLFAYGLSTFPRRPGDAADPRILLLLAWLLPMCADVFGAGGPTHDLRGLVPGLVIIVPMAVLGARKCGLPGALPAFGALCIAQLESWSQRLVADSGRVDTTEVAMARFVSQQLPVGATVAGDEPGALGYLGGHRFLDLHGTFTPSVLGAALDGPAGVFHYIDREKPDLVVVAQGWPPGFVDSGLLSVLASVSHSRGADTATLLAARPNYTLFEARHALPRGPGGVLDGLDEGDRVSEQAHAWGVEPGGGVSEVVAGDWETQDGGEQTVVRVVDSARRHDRREGFRLAGESRSARLVARLGPSTSPESLRITWTTTHAGGVEKASRDVPLPVIPGWYTLSLDLGPVSGQTTFEIERQTGLGGTSGGWAPAYWWLMG